MPNIINNNSSNFKNALHDFQSSRSRPKMTKDYDDINWANLKTTVSYQ